VTVAAPMLDSDVLVTRDELEVAARPLIDQTVRITQGVIRAAGVQPERIAGLFLVGGASRMPLVATQLHRALGQPAVALEQPELVVAQGNAIIGANSLETPRGSVSAGHRAVSSEVWSAKEVSTSTVPSALQLPSSLVPSQPRTAGNQAPTDGEAGAAKHAELQFAEPQPGDQAAVRPPSAPASTEPVVPKLRVVLDPHISAAPSSPPSADPTLGGPSRQSIASSKLPAAGVYPPLVATILVRFLAGFAALLLISYLAIPDRYRGTGGPVWKPAYGVWAGAAVVSTLLIVVAGARYRANRPTWPSVVVTTAAIVLAATVATRSLNNVMTANHLSDVFALRNLEFRKAPDSFILTYGTFFQSLTLVIIAAFTWGYRGVRRQIRDQANSAGNVPQGRPTPTGRPPLTILVAIAMLFIASAGSLGSAVLLAIDLITLGWEITVLEFFGELIAATPLIVMPVVAMRLRRPGRGPYAIVIPLTVVFVFLAALLVIVPLLVAFASPVAPWPTALTAAALIAAAILIFNESSQRWLTSSGL